MKKNDRKFLRRDIFLINNPNMKPLKQCLYKIIDEKNISKTMLGRKLGWSNMQIARFYNDEHNSTIEVILKVSKVLGYDLLIGLEESEDKENI